MLSLYFERNITMHWKIACLGLISFCANTVYALSYYETDEELQLWRDIARPGHILLIEHAEAAITEDATKLDVQIGRAHV